MFEAENITNAQLSQHSSPGNSDKHKREKQSINNSASAGLAPDKAEPADSRGSAAAVPSGGRSSGACGAPRGAQRPPRCPAGLRGAPAPRQPEGKADFAVISESPALISDPTPQLVNNPNTAEPTSGAVCKQGRRECPGSRRWHTHVPGTTVLALAPALGYHDCCIIVLTR